MCFETGHSRELLVAHGTNRIFCIVRTFMKCQVEFNIKGLGALVTSVWLVILLMLPHVTLKLGLFWKRQQTNFTFVEVWNWTVIINVIIIQGQNSIGVAARRAVPGLRGAAPRHRRGGPPLTRALPRRAGAHARHRRAGWRAGERAAAAGPSPPGSLGDGARTRGQQRSDRAGLGGFHGPRAAAGALGAGGGGGGAAVRMRGPHRRRRRRHLARRSAGLAGPQAPGPGLQLCLGGASVLHAGPRTPIGTTSPLTTQPQLLGKWKGSEGG